MPGGLACPRRRSTRICGPWVIGLAGRWQEAAAAWAEIGDPYEEALELADSGEVEPLLRALALLDGLGAGPAANRVRIRLRQLGVRTLPRGSLPQSRVESRRAHRPPDGHHGHARRRADQRRDRRPTGAVGADGRPPRVIGAHQARSRQPARRGTAGSGVATRPPIDISQWQWNMLPG